MRLSRLLYFLLLAFLLITGCSNAPAANSGVQSQQNNPAPAPVQKENTQANTQPTSVQSKEVALIFSDDNLMEQYKEMRTIKSAHEEDLPMEALKEWQKGPKNNKLIGLLPADVEIQSVKKDGDNAVVSFSSNIKKANLGSTGEEMLLQQVSTILSQFGYKQTKFLIDGKEVDSILGHEDTSKPVNPLSLDQIKEMK
ncbi:GerMN domain-containing protein [Aneurinibacillus terranovensis]|uniref:GerMN domain-containing protein n=1 Tax=Aneurinibacillus terranovensis TaxID=278991 RepID=UPI0006852B3E|nr:GerMN domain-containing protein [Aneurinibacillus terranovensis]